VTSIDLDVTARHQRQDPRVCCGINRFGCDASAISVREIPRRPAWGTVMCCDVNRFGCDTNGDKPEADT
jgi:hypothetical protein